MRWNNKNVDPNRGWIYENAKEQQKRRSKGGVDLRKAIGTEKT
ncbi:hypothetical protein J8TS2_13240 [Lederbergia ruris]|uniref:Uncharacterized protein n=1 Tax=Lederbergia ruris TaxID=217495 RepID=A0ABQ4KGA7_9BACI|nr:hypothetical protein J8TS2_13240 [Lederbergia ruris]